MQFIKCLQLALEHTKETLAQLKKEHKDTKSSNNNELYKPFGQRRSRYNKTE